jgi:hypothetical protein
MIESNSKLFVPSRIWISEVLENPEELEEALAQALKFRGDWMAVTAWYPSPLPESVLISFRLPPS